MVAHHRKNTDTIAAMTTHTTALDSLRAVTDVVADTGDIDAVSRYRPQDVTTNPSLLYQAAQLPQFASLVAQLRGHGNATSCFAIHVGAQLAAQVSGYVSTEVDAVLSYDTDATIAQAKQLLALYEDAGISRRRILIKIAATWEGIVACRQLQADGINCNMTLIFDLVQAQAAIHAGAFLLSPFVGRIYDWYKAQLGHDITAENDPGVHLVRSIFAFIRMHRHTTIVMGASFRHVGQILALAGCDKLTIAPSLLAQLESLPADSVNSSAITGHHGHNIDDNAPISELTFRDRLTANAMASEKLQGGIDAFIHDQQKLTACFAHADSQ